MTEHDPPRLRDPGAGGSPLVRAALEAARGRGPTPANLAAIAARLPLANGAATAATAGSLLPSIVIGAGLGLVVSLGAFVFAPSAPTDRPAPSVAPSLVVSASALVPSRALEAPVSTTAPAPRPRSEPAPSGARAPSSSTVASAPSSDASSAPGDAPPSSVGAPVASADERETEAHLLSRAQQEIAASPARALALTDEHARRFPGGALGQEREVVAIQALLALGRASDARARADRFIAAFPTSAHRRRIEALLP